MANWYARAMICYLLGGCRRAAARGTKGGSGGRQSPAFPIQHRQRIRLNGDVPPVRVKPSTLGCVGVRMAQGRDSAQFAGFAGAATGPFGLG
jgi:hypothetical protein